ncbi:hypothetical protein [Paenibacillus rubinfantis]|uniref:hypothetical protein n=1 Tax=Paenibacillus rubinfantis TaxID=1720296 RepID=UPI001E38F2F7|nr:hypothetical protein [Paenibacillus rubinfantis]
MRQGDQLPVAKADDGQRSALPQCPVRGGKHAGWGEQRMEPAGNGGESRGDDIVHPQLGQQRMAGNQAA